jgi:hypothetical protein
VDVPIVDFMPVIFKTVDIRIPLIKVSDFGGTPNNIGVVPVIILCPSFYAVTL